MGSFNEELRTLNKAKQEMLERCGWVANEEVYPIKVFGDMVGFGCPGMTEPQTHSMFPVFALIE
jgi:hypothetical protein